MTNHQAKPTFEAFIETCTPLLKIPELEERMRERVRSIVAELLHFQPDNDPIKNLTQFLQTDQNFLGVLLALTNLSQEKFLRIITAQRFAVQDFGNEWNADTIYRKLKQNDQFAEMIAGLFLEGRNNTLLASQVADFYLDQLALPENWSEIIHNERIIENVIRRKLTGEYTDQKGAFVEGKIRSFLDDVQKKYGISHAHGQVKLVGKEVDHAIPSLVEPYVLVMVSYMETTSSGQTTRANEQQAMYTKIVGDNVRYAPNERVLVNIVDGAGWLARRPDLRKLYAGCHYCLNMNTFDQLEAIILQHVPRQFFAHYPHGSI